MKKFHKIAIPNPCHEDWNTMSQTNKGRHCDSCAKTVIDFSKMSTMQIQDFISKNDQGAICGYFKTNQLDTIHLSIPISIIQRKHSMKMSFLLALTLTMGTTLMSCTTHEGNRQKIEQIQILEDDNHENSSPESHNIKCSKNNPRAYPNKETIITNNTITLGEISNKEEDSLNTIPNPEWIVGDLKITLGLIDSVKDTDLHDPIPYHLLNIFPSFDNIPKKKRTKEAFSKQINAFVSKNFDISIGKKLGLKGIHRIYSKFEID